jgi:hypothetical protein
MKSLVVSSLPQMSRSIRRCGMSFPLAALAVAMLCAAGPAIAQTQNAGAAASAQPAAQAQSAPLVSAPVPVAEQASLSNPFSDSNSAFAADQESVPAQSFTAPAHTQGPHHTLGVTMAILGMVAVGGGAASFAVAEQHCKHFTGICGDLHTGGLATLSAGGAVAAVGFYWQFQKPKQQ